MLKQISPEMTLSEMVEAVRGKGFNPDELRVRSPRRDLEFYRVRNFLDISIAFGRLNFDQQVVFLRRFLERWYRAFINDDAGASIAEVDAFLGPADDSDGPSASNARPLLFVMSADSELLEGWFGIPSSIDGAGVTTGLCGGCLFRLMSRGQTQTPKDLFDKLDVSHTWGLSSLSLPEGGTLYYPAMGLLFRGL